MSASPRTVLGIDASTQSLSAVLLNSSNGEILWSRSLAYRDDPRLVGFGFEHETMIIPAREPGEAEQPPRLFIAALEALFADLKAAGFDTAAIAAIRTTIAALLDIRLMVGKFRDIMEGEEAAVPS